MALPPWRTRHGCTVGIDRDPPVSYFHPGRVVEVPERQLLRTSWCCWCNSTRGRFCCWWFCGDVLFNIHTPPRTMPFTSSFGLSEDSTFVIHDFAFVASSNSFTLGLYEILATPRPQSRLTRIARFTRITRLRSHLFSTRILLIPSETCLSIPPVQSFTLLNDSLSVTSSTLLVSCVYLPRLSTYPGVLNVVRRCGNLVGFVAAACHRVHDV